MNLQQQQNAGRDPYWYQREQVETYVSLGLDRAEYFAELDRFVFEDTFYNVFGATCLNKLSGEFGHTYRNIGELISDKLETVAEKCRLSECECAVIADQVAKLGLTFGSDTLAWQEYRKTKRAYFRLLPLAVLNFHSASTVRLYCGHKPSPPSLHI